MSRLFWKKIWFWGGRVSKANRLPIVSQATNLSFESRRPPDAIGGLHNGPATVGGVGGRKQAPSPTRTMVLMQTPVRDGTHQGLRSQLRKIFDPFEIKVIQSEIIISPHVEVSGVFLVEQMVVIKPPPEKQTGIWKKRGKDMGSSYFKERPFQSQ